MKRIVTVVGARPQFIKAAAISRAIRQRWAGQIEEVLVHTGQHYDDNMSQVFFDELEIPRPGHHLGISGGGHGAMTGRMLESVEQVLLQEKPDWLLIYGDTNSTLAGALAAAKLHIPVAHVEAGLRSFNMRMPEEVNRIVADRVSTLLFCPTEAAVDNLRAEGRTAGVSNVGDVMFDVALYSRERALARSRVLETLGLSRGGFVLATCHRAENTDDPARLAPVLRALGRIAANRPVVLPLHPRTARLVEQYGLRELLAPLTVVEPLSFLDMVALEQSAVAIVTDSGGVQKEAFFYGVPCVTMRDETEWVETVSLGWNQLVGADEDAIVRAFDSVLTTPPKAATARPYGDGEAAHRILEQLA
ncbi:MAG: UDP-N-acetylglucosamine 2-epimerase (non-hydrolyzing) [Burkholderiaceae bacterium]|nr:UDP-N-acetylglucosamine 2-epimerase (non-hydrolyzing) [Burkholderiaceae bacterium]